MAHKSTADCQLASVSNLAVPHYHINLSHIWIWCLQIDPYEFAEPRDIIPELKKDFWEGIESAKWSERKAACTTLKELASYPRLASGDYGDVNRELKKIISKDSNIQVWFMVLTRAGLPCNARLGCRTWPQLKSCV
jgi:hypothetical protein